MSIFPFLNGQDGIVDNTEVLKIYKEIAWDFERDKPIFENGDFKIIEGNEALKVWIYKAIKTERFALNIYSWNYGSDINTLINKGYSKEFTIAESKRYIEEALTQNEYIKSVQIKEVVFENDKLSIDVLVSSVYGDLNIDMKF